MVDGQKSDKSVNTWNFVVLLLAYGTEIRTGRNKNLEGHPAKLSKAKTEIVTASSFFSSNSLVCYCKNKISGGAAD